MLSRLTVDSFFPPGLDNSLFYHFQYIRNACLWEMNKKLQSRIIFKNYHLKLHHYEITIISIVWMSHNLFNGYWGHFNVSDLKPEEVAFLGCAYSYKMHSEWYNFWVLKEIRHSRQQHGLSQHQSQERIYAYIIPSFSMKGNNRIRNINPDSEDRTPLLWNFGSLLRSYKAEVLVGSTRTS